jgi:23S rRNA pseudouridine1911/1915/1917 synthase
MSAAAGFEILYEEGACLAVAKPAGLPTQAPPGIESLETRIKAFLAERACGNGGETAEIYLAVPHRLDRPVSGAMVFATDRRAARKLSRQFERRQVRKIYWACVAGRVDPPVGTWTDMLWKVHGQPRAVVDAAHPDAQQAILHYRTLGVHRDGSWLEVELETGRTHQVRVQAASRGHAVLGDAHYGSAVPFGQQYENERLRAIALHARRLTFRHPESRAEVTVTAPPGEAWQALGLDLAAADEQARG